MRRGDAPEGWEQVYSGPRVEGDVLMAVLEANGLEPVMDQISPQGWWSGSVLEDCRIYVPTGQAEAARAALDSQPLEADDTP